MTLDTHEENYLDTAEGRKLPVVHCVRNTPGWTLDEGIAAALEGKDITVVEKPTFASLQLPALIGAAAGDEPYTLELIGLCTDICVISNALVLKTSFPEAPISVDATCCAGVTPELHLAAPAAMRSCQIEILNR